MHFNDMKSDIVTKKLTTIRLMCGYKSNDVNVTKVDKTSRKEQEIKRRYFVERDERYLMKVFLVQLRGRAWFDRVITEIRTGFAGRRP